MGVTRSLQPGVPATLKNSSQQLRAHHLVRTLQSLLATPNIFSSPSCPLPCPSVSPSQLISQNFSYNFPPPNQFPLLPIFTKYTSPAPPLTTTFSQPPSGTVWIQPKILEAKEQVDVIQEVQARAPTLLMKLSFLS